MGNPAMTTALDGLLDPLSRCLDAESARRSTQSYSNLAFGVAHDPPGINAR
jgi:hypothetical protein